LAKRNALHPKAGISILRLTLVELGHRYGLVELPASGVSDDRGVVHGNRRATVTTAPCPAHAIARY
jgi:hypothetical protein